MSRQFNQGEFVYVPACSFLYKFGANTCDYFTKQVKTQKPLYLMFLRQNDINKSYYDIFFDGSVWSVSSDDVYDYEVEK
tara:strand:- start:440 stop:676 length:237 start_codon:yes stop_codon:yes gene_type:complete